MKIFLALLAALSLVACQSPPKAIAYLTLSDVAHTVDSAMKLYGKACVAGKVSVEQQATVDKLHEKYRVAFGSAIRVARHNYKAPVPDTITSIVTELITTLQQLAL